MELLILGNNNALESHCNLSGKNVREQYYEIIGGYSPEVRLELEADKSEKALLLLVDDHNNVMAGATLQHHCNELRDGKHLPKDGDGEVGYMCNVVTSPQYAALAPSLVLQKQILQALQSGGLGVSVLAGNV